MRPNKDEGGGEPEHDELTMPTGSDGLTLQKTLEEFLAQTKVSVSLDITNCTLTIMVNIL